MKLKKDWLDDKLRQGVDGRVHWAVAAAIYAIATAVFAYFAYNARYATFDTFNARDLPGLLTAVTVMFTTLYAAALAVQFFILQRGRAVAAIYLMAALITGLSLLGKISLLDYVSDDFDIFLSEWIWMMSEESLRGALGLYLGDYNPPYLYLLAIMSRFPDFSFLYMVKFVSIGADILLAYFAMKLASFKSEGPVFQLSFFHLTLLLPTVVFNGAYWAQCDAIYAGLALGGLYMGLKKRPCASIVLFTVALSFKLQAIFLLPMLLPLWSVKRLRLRHLLLAPPVYMAMLVPALIGGKTLHSVLTVYLQQANNYAELTMNAPSIYQLMPTASFREFNGMGILFALALVFCLCAAMYQKRRTLTAQSMILCAALMCLAIPLVLPRMHERYFFLADVLALVVAAYNPKRFYLPLAVGFASYCCYVEALPGPALYPLSYMSLIMIGATALVAYDLARQLRADEAGAHAPYLLGMEECA